jgi:LacI family transcriptional regulator
MPTIFDVAKKASVSVMTVSRVLNNPKIVSKKTINKVHMVMDNLGYQPSQIARSMVKKKTNTIGVIMPDIKNTFFNNWFRFIEDYASSHNYNLLLCNTDEEPTKELKYVKLFQSQRVDGVLITPCSRESIEYLLRTKMNFVSVDRLFEDMKTDCVTTNHYNGAFKGADYLIKLGHNNIAVLHGSGFLYPDLQRQNGFKDSMKQNKINLNSDLMINCEFDELLAYSKVKEILKSKIKPSAIFSFNSLMMIGAIKAIRELKLRIPADISLLCFDEIPGHEIFEPKITFVKQSIEKLGNRSIKMLIDKIKKPSSKFSKILLEPELVIGKSCRKV